MLHKALTYFGVIGVFAAGAGLGALLTARFGIRGIWLSCALLAVSFLLMFIREDLEEDPVIRKDLAEIRRDGTAIRQELGREQIPSLFHFPRHKRRLFLCCRGYILLAPPEFQTIQAALLVYFVLYVSYPRRLLLE